MKTQIEKLDRLIREIEMDEYLNEETLPKIREAKGLLNTLHEQCDIANVSKRYTEKDMDAAYDKGYMDGAHTTSDPY